MVRGSKKEVAVEERNPEVETQKRLKKLAFKSGILSETPAKAFSPLSPSAVVAKHHGKDILRKSQRKNRYLFCFSGLLAPVAGGKIGELKDLGTKNPILYLDFPQGQMKLLGTIVYPKNKYLTLQFSRGGKQATCEDYFDTMIVFSDAWWIGTKEDNPNETRLDFPKDLPEAEHKEYDFTGGASAKTVKKQAGDISGTKVVEPLKIDSEDDLSDDKYNPEGMDKVTPTRQSKRTARKTSNVAESTSGDEVMIDADMSSIENKIIKSSKDTPLKNDTAAASSTPAAQVQRSVTRLTKSKEASQNRNNALVQTTISTMFKKVKEKVKVDDEEEDNDDIEEFSSSSKEGESDDDYVASD
ncbi:DNA-binding protein RHL1 [Impatiens glandulifera]|uniref:DNA-binding protein RHL1 n=1 Tax=Impatiens glandulifera TaxID=253017 RepID=UPI001FB0E701|nr:DNA-binding protein RHL1 [Impatiens glandulifera]